MGRKKINIREIENSRQKTVTFARRRAGLIKKAHELSILCGVKVAVVIFDSKNASHVYSSADTPEELFTRYLNKQFLTNESRKRKDTAESSDDNGGTYGFDGNGTFMRRRLAVVNEYKVTSDGPNSRNLHVKYTKQYHNPSSNANKRQSTASTASTNTLDQSSPSTMLGSLNDPVYLPNGDIGPISNHAALGQQLMCGLPTRSASLLKRDMDVIGYPVSSAVSILPFGQGNPGECAAPFQNYHMPFANVDGGMGVGQAVDARGADSLGNTTHDLSALSLLSDNGGHVNGGHGLIGGMGAAPGMPNDIKPLAFDNMFGVNLQREGGSPISSSGSSNYSSCNGLSKQTGDNDEHRDKRSKSQVHTGSSAFSGDMDISLVENFLSNPGVAELLNTPWGQAQNSNDCASSETYESESEGEDDVSNESDDNDDYEDDVGNDDDDNDDDGNDNLQYEEQQLMPTHEPLAPFAAGDNSSMQAHHSMVCTLQSLGMYPAAGAIDDKSFQQFYSAVSQAQASAGMVPAFSHIDSRHIDSHQLNTNISGSQPLNLRPEMLLAANNGRAF
ncbi:hypothetical protein IWW50_001606 [Coemansia erecta]|nr:hypothetical protein IWW50_001606 [Coemansia erecta]